MKILNSLSFLPQGPFVSIKHVSWGFTLQLTLNFGRAYIQPKSSIPIGGEVQL
jgi:hypothetical protein